MGLDTSGMPPSVRCNILPHAIHSATEPREQIAVWSFATRRRNRLAALPEDEDTVVVSYQAGNQLRHRLIGEAAGRGDCDSPYGGRYGVGFTECVRGGDHDFIEEATAKA